MPMPDTGGAQEPGSGRPPTIEELETLHRALGPLEREELLECLLIAASKSPTAMMQALSPWLLEAAVRELTKDGGDAQSSFS
jgi:hypothetical protein